MYEWIPVTEMLPECERAFNRIWVAQSRRVLMVRDDGVINIGQLTKFVDIAEWLVDGLPVATPTHWMPLPDLPKENK